MDLRPVWGSPIKIKKGIDTNERLGELRGEAPPVEDTRVLLTLQQRLYRSGLFGTDGRGHITLLIRTILESENNQDALIEPIVSAVSPCMRPEWTGPGVRWIECFDSIPLKSMLNTLRDLFGKQDLFDHYCVALRRKIAAILSSRLPHLCSQFGKIATKLRHAFWSSCHLTDFSRCTMLSSLTSFKERKHFWRSTWKTTILQ
jgi:hypothetical protein